MDSRDCILHIIEWIKVNGHLLPLDSRNLKYRTDMIARTGKSHIGDGTKVSQWKRRGIKKLSDGTTLRAFEGHLLIFDIEVIILVHEKDDVVTKIEHGTEEYFENTYGIRIGDYCGMN